MENQKNPPYFLLYIIIFIVGVRTFAPMLYDKNLVKGDGFSVKKPDGWIVQKEKHEIIFTCPENDLMTDMPLAIFSIYSEKQQAAIFMDDFFPEVLSSLKRENGKILKTGAEKIDNLPAQWVLFRYNRPDIAVMTLYMADDFNRLTRIQYIASGKRFKEFGKDFDAFKKSVMFR